MVIDKIHISNLKGESHVVIYKDEGLTNMPASERSDRQRAIVSEVLAKEWDSSSVTLIHDSEGAPSISEFPEMNISISHSGNWVAVQWSEELAVGIDIQVIKDGLYKGRYYFVNADEEVKHEMNDSNLLIIWSAKEALYKLKKGAVSRYKEAITIVEIGEEGILAEVDAEEINCGYIKNDEYILVYAD